MGKLVTAAEMRALEQAAVDAGESWDGLMQRAGRGMAELALRRLGDPRGRRCVVLIGPGNNGGDGLVAARHLHDVGAQVTLALWKREERASDHNWRQCRERGIAEHWTSQLNDDELRKLFAGADIVLDALLGAGVSKPLTGEVRRIVELLNAVRERRAGDRPQVLAVDLASGIDTDSGKRWDVAVDADLSMAAGLAKRGQRQGAGLTHTGELVVVPLDLPAQEEEQIMVEELSQTGLRELLPARPDDSHKGSYGKVMLVAGSLFYPGAPVLAATAATRSGAGLVTLALARAIYSAAAAALHEATYIPLPEDKPGTLGEAAAHEVRKHIAGYGALLVGCGLGREDDTGRFLEELLGLKTRHYRHSLGFLPREDLEPVARHRPGIGFLAHGAAQEQQQAVELPPLVIDADGLNLLAQIENWHQQLPAERAILTPHPGEMSRLLGVEQIEDPIGQAQEAAQRWRQVVILKGSSTTIAAPDGRVTVHARPNAALASAGTGDVLAGLVSGLVAQGCTLYDAARLGVGVHSLAGELLANELGKRGVVAGDLLARLPQAFKTLEG